MQGTDGRREWNSICKFHGEKVIIEKSKKNAVKSHIISHAKCKLPHHIWLNSSLIDCNILLCKHIPNIIREVIKKTFLFTQISLASVLRTPSQNVKSLSTWHKNTIYVSLYNLYCIINGCFLCGFSEIWEDLGSFFHWV